MIAFGKLRNHLTVLYGLATNLPKTACCKIFLGGSIQNDGLVKVVEDKELEQQPSPRIVKVCKRQCSG